jgi:hypothetical protein
MIVPRTVLTGLATLTLLGFGIHARAENSHLEMLEAKDAFTELSSTEGVVLVDLYADW